MLLVVERLTTQGDRYTGILIGKFYRELIKNKISKAAALGAGRKGNWL